MRPRLILAVLALLLAHPDALRAQDPPGAGAGRGAESADPEFLALQRAFRLAHRSLQNDRGLRDGDRPALLAFRDRVRAYTERHPDHGGAVALDLQVSIWLDEPAEVSRLFDRLSGLRPADAAIALARVEYLRQRGELDDEAMFDTYRSLIERFPGNAQVCLGWAEALPGRMRYEDAAELLATADADPAREPKLARLLADMLFASHRFEEALSTIRSIPQEALQGSYQVRAQVERETPIYEEYAALWAAEQALRAAEAEADDLPRAEVKTSKGTILVELFENEAPNTVKNFVSLADSGFYAGAKFHRFEPDFMIQGGDPNTKPGGTGSAGLGDPGYSIPDEHGAEPFRRHFGDTLAMAKKGPPNTGGCQFYFAHRPAPWLNGEHTVFGRVIDGLDVVRALRPDDEILEIVVVRRRPGTEYQPSTIPILPSPPPGVLKRLEGGPGS